MTRNSMLHLGAHFLLGCALFNRIITTHVLVYAFLPPQPSSSFQRLRTLPQQSSPTQENRSMQPQRQRQFAVSAASSSLVSSNQELLPGIAAIDQFNEDLFDKLETLRNQPYFRYYSVDIMASCEYIPQQLFECYTESCEIYPEDETEIPQAIRTKDMEESEFELDGWARWDMPSEDYYDAHTQSEGYTGYDGAEVWNFIHERICFQGYSYDTDHWKADFNKAVSGLHSMISAQVIRGIREKVQNGEKFSEKEVWRDPDQEFARRLGTNGETPLALENMYFCFMLLLSAAVKARDRLLADCQTQRIDPDMVDDLKAVLSSPLLEQHESSVRVASQKLHDHAVRDSDSVEALWEARMRSRDMLRIMNCVQCNKCRLHGKIAILGLTTALQILVGRTGEGGDPQKVHRVELAALMTTLHKFSTAVKFSQEMQA